MLSFRWRTAALGYRRRTIVVGFKWRTLVVSGLEQVNNYSGWLQMESNGGLGATVVSFRFSNWLYIEHDSFGHQMENVR